ncbi:MAG: type II secretion system F family protein [Thermoanaerobaculia bacterium]
MSVQFVCRVGTPGGKVLESVFEAEDEKSLRRDLETRGYHLFELRRRGRLRSLGLSGLGRERSSVPLQELILFNRELAALLRSGLPLVQALDLLVVRQKGELGKLLGQILERVRGGESFSQVVLSYSDAFPPLYAPTLQAGERSGELEKVLRRFIRYQQLVRETRRKIVSSLIYPAVLIGLSFALIAVMTIYVLPKFQDFFSGLDAELPLLTRMMMQTSSFVRDRGLLVAACVAALLIVFFQWRRTVRGRIAFDGLKLKLPVLGGVVESLSISEFSRSLGTLLAGGIPIVPALESAVGAVGNAWVRHRLQSLPGEVRQGRPLAECLEETGVASDLVVSMTRVGESTGALDAMLEDVSTFLDEQVESRMERLLSLLEPLMLIFMGLLVTLILSAVYLPLYSLLGRVNG